MSIGRLARGAFAVAAGYILFAIPVAALYTLTGHEPPAPASLAFKVLSTLYGVAIAIGAGYVAAFIGSHAAPAAPAVLAGLIALGAVISSAMVPAGGVIWSQAVAALLMAPAAMLGGLLRRRRRRGPRARPP